jgi:DNA-binding CsgD family transcriptional regulator
MMTVKAPVNNNQRDAQICALAASGSTYSAISRKVGLSGERVRQIVEAAKRKAARNARIRAKFAGLFDSL